jgi:hypothetical protein
MIEDATEQGIKTAFKVFTDTLDPEDAVTYRCFALDDEDESGEAREARKYPLVEITAAPNVPTHHRSTFRDVPVELRFATHKNQDRKREKLVELYDGCRAILDAASPVTVAGYNVTGIIIESGGESGVDENEQYYMLPIVVKLCGA